MKDMDVLATLVNLLRQGCNQESFTGTISLESCSISVGSTETTNKSSKVQKVINDKSQNECGVQLSLPAQNLFGVFRKREK
jgi:hypothetical protein